MGIQTTTKDAPMRTDLPFAIAVPIVVVCFAAILMIWAMSGTTVSRVESQRAVAHTTGTASKRPNDNAVPAPRAPNSDRTGDGAWGTKGVESKSP
jgi:hypothetical protein